jgi:hypothetical protein
MPIVELPGDGLGELGLAVRARLAGKSDGQIGAGQESGGYGDRN